MKWLALLALLPMLAVADPVFNDVGLKQTNCAPGYARSDSARIGTLNPGLFRSGTLDIALPDEPKIRAKKVKSSATEWVGDVEGGTLVVVKHRDTITAALNVNGRTWEIIPNCGGHVLYELDPASKAPDEEPFVPAYPGRPPDADEAEVVRGPTTHDVLVLYTTAAETKWTLPTLQSRIALAMSNTNAWLTKSGSDQQVRSVAVLPSPTQESGVSMTQTYYNLRGNPTAQALRNQYFADGVMLISTDPGGVVGVGGLTHSCCTSAGKLTSLEQWSIVNSDHTSSRTPAHEWGHMNGLQHNREDSSQTSPGYHYGARRCISDGTGFRDIMAYTCTGATLITYFSNPAILYQGNPIGAYYATDPTIASENARVLNENGPKFANFRNPGGTTEPPPPPVPSPPQNLIATLTSGAVVLTWGYADNLATRVDVQRAKRNKNGKWSGYQTIASVAVPTQSYTDRPAAGTYRYVVKAVNTSGTSAPAGPAAVTL